MGPMYIETPDIRCHIDTMYIETYYISSHMGPMYIETPDIYIYIYSRIVQKFLA